MLYFLLVSPQKSQKNKQKKDKKTKNHLPISTELQSVTFEVQNQVKHGTEMQSFVAAILSFV